MVVGQAPEGPFRIPPANLPSAARLYLEHSIAPGTPLASAVRLRIRGEIKLRLRRGDRRGTNFLGLHRTKPNSGGLVFWTERFEREGEFFRATVEQAENR